MPQAALLAALFSLMACSGQAEKLRDQAIQQAAQEALDKAAGAAGARATLTGEGVNISVGGQDFSLTAGGAPQENAAARALPVFPGARLVSRVQGQAEASLIFVTGETAEKALAFYETELATRAFIKEGGVSDGERFSAYWGDGATRISVFAFHRAREKDTLLTLVVAEAGSPAP
ncbi:MAG: hypothetical protein HY804_12925 [Nitrospinae bacterium]|nr:hypothetical protein [Nitrospinota bacterium]